MEIHKIYGQYGIDVAPEGHKHFRQGWVQVECPFCTGNPGYHLGYNLEGQYFNCWRCGFKESTRAVANILKVPVRDAKRIIRENKGTAATTTTTGKKEYYPEILKRKHFRFPANAKPLSKVEYVQKYLRGRGFSGDDINRIKGTYKLYATGPISHLDQMDMRFRLVAPIFWQGKEVTWQSRDTTSLSGLKYLACPKNRELVHHKHLLYLPKKPIKTKKIVLVEGVFDVWKILCAMRTPIGTCGFGVELKDEQIKLLTQYDLVWIWLDPDAAGIQKGKQIAARLEFAGTATRIIKTEKDPGDTEKAEIEEILKDF